VDPLSEGSARAVPGQVEHQSAYWLRRHAVGLILLACGTLALVAAIWAHSRLYQPRPMSLADAIAAVGSGAVDYVTLDARPDLEIKLYGISRNNDIAHTPERLSRFSPLDGIPLTGADAVADWPSVVDAEVRLDGPLLPSQDSGYLFFQGTKPTGSQKSGIVFPTLLRYYVAKAVIGAQTLFVMSPGFQRLAIPRIPGSDNSDESFFSQQVEEWLAQGRWRGKLVHADDFFAQTGKSAVVSGSSLEHSWLVVTDTDASFDRRGLHFYVPVQDSARKIWLQVPLGSADWQKPRLAGLLLAVGTHSFAPDANGPVGLLRLDPAVVKAYLDARWWRHWGLYIGLVGLLVAVAGLFLIILNETRWRLFRPGMPDYLVPFASFLVPEPARRSLMLAGSGALMLILAVVCFGLGVVAAPAEGEPHWFTWIAQRAIENAALAAAVSFFVVGRGVLSGGAARVLQQDKRKPVMYLRSFQADTHSQDPVGSERALAVAASWLGPVVAIGKPGEHFPPLGAARLYVDEAHWREVVTALIATSEFVILRIGRTDGFWWEWNHLVAHIDPTKVLIYLRVPERKELYAEFVQRVGRTLPHPLPDNSWRAIFLTFGPDWTPHLIRDERGLTRGILDLIRDVFLAVPGSVSCRIALAGALRLQGKSLSTRLSAREWASLAVFACAAASFALN
jgi:hypothetical protein